MGPDLCIDRGLSLAQWLKLIEETEPQPPCCEISEAKYTFIAIQIFFLLISVNLSWKAFWSSNDGPGLRNGSFATSIEVI
jgi:hypothetical protein